jgi:HlyD family secretion protein
VAEPSRNIIDAVGVKPYRSNRQRSQALIAVVVVVIVAGLSAGAYVLLAPREQVYVVGDYESAVVKLGSLVQTTQASGTVAFPVQMRLTSPEEGYADRLYVAAGDAVETGQALASLDVPDLEESLEDLRSALAEAERTYEKTRAQNRIAVGRAVREIEALEREIVDAQKEQERVRALVSVNASRESELDAARDAVVGLVAKRDEAQMRLAEDQELYELEEQSRRATVVDYETKIARLLERIAATTIKSPMDGEVLEANSSLAVPGSPIANNAELFTVADPASALVELEVLEQYSALLAIGREVKLTVGSASFSGRISSIGRVATQSSDGLGATVLVEVTPEEPGQTLLLGNTAVGEIELGEKENIMIIPRGPYLTTGSRRYLYRISDNTAERVPVTFGDVQGSMVEIVSGVEPGDEVITSGYQNFIEYESIRLKEGEKR